MINWLSSNEKIRGNIQTMLSGRRLRMGASNGASVEQRNKRQFSFPRTLRKLESRLFNSKSDLMSGKLTERLFHLPNSLSSCNANECLTRFHSLILFRSSIQMLVESVNMVVQYFFHRRGGWSHPYFAVLADTIFSTIQTRLRSQPNGKLTMRSQAVAIRIENLNRADDVRLETS